MKTESLLHLKKDHHPCAGTEILSSQMFPAANQGSYLVANVIGFQGIFQYQIIDDDSGFSATEVDPIVHSSDPRFRPSDIETGPDGRGNWDIFGRDDGGGGDAFYPVMEAVTLKDVTVTYRDASSGWTGALELELLSERRDEDGSIQTDGSGVSGGGIMLAW